MGSTSKVFVTALMAAAPLVGLSLAADAKSPIELSNSQLDRITAGANTVDASATGLGTGAFSISSSNTNSVVGVNPGANPVLYSQGGLAVGTAVGYGTNFGNQQQPASSSTDVTTGGTADGNFQANVSNNVRLSALGLTVQIGFTSTYGAFALGL